MSIFRFSIFTEYLSQISCRTEIRKFRLSANQRLVTLWVKNTENRRGLLTNPRRFEGFVRPRRSLGETVGAAEMYGFQTTNRIFRLIIVVRCERDTKGTFLFPIDNFLVTLTRQRGIHEKTRLSAGFLCLNDSPFPVVRC